MFDGGVPHAIPAAVFAVDSPYCAQLCQVVAGHSFADVAPLMWSFEPDPGAWNRQFRSSSSEFAVAEAAVGGRVNDGVQICLALSRRHSPFLGRCENEHQPTGGASLPHDIEKPAAGMRAIGGLITVASVTDSLIDFYSFPIGIQFVRNYHL